MTISRWTTIISIVAAITLASASARADRCDDLAAQLKGQIEGLTVGKTVANAIYLDHPAATRLRLGCANRSISNELYAATDSRKPSPAFVSFVATAAAIIFTIPKSDTQKAAARCLSRMGLLRGDDIKLRFRRLDLRCTRSKNEATIAISREKSA